MIDAMINIWQVIVIFSLGWGLKMFRDAIKSNYYSYNVDTKKWEGVKVTLHIPDKWDWYCNPAISWENKDRGWLWKLLTPVSDLYHLLASMFMLCFLLALQEELLLMVIIWIVGILFGNLIYKLVK